MLGILKIQEAYTNIVVLDEGSGVVPLCCGYYDCEHKLALVGTAWAILTSFLLVGSCEVQWNNQCLGCPPRWMRSVLNSFAVRKPRILLLPPDLTNPHWNHGTEVMVSSTAQFSTVTSLLSQTMSRSALLPPHRFLGSRATISQGSHNSAVIRQYLLSPSILLGQCQIKHPQTENCPWEFGPQH